jgi:2-furoyl-CoA dehydrogenase large subunit
LGAAQGAGQLRLSEGPDGTRIDYDYAISVAGTAAAIGGRMLDAATRALIARFFDRLRAEAANGAGAQTARLRWLRRMLGRAE